MPSAFLLLREEERESGRLPSYPREEGRARREPCPLPSSSREKKRGTERREPCTPPYAWPAAFLSRERRGGPCTPPSCPREEERVRRAWRPCLPRLESRRECLALFLPTIERRGASPSAIMSVDPRAESLALDLPEKEGESLALALCHPVLERGESFAFFPPPPY